MKTKITLSIIAFVMAISAGTIKLYAGDKVLKSNSAIELANRLDKVLNTSNVKTSQPEETTSESQLNQNENRDYWEDLVVVPWMIKEVVVKPTSKYKNASTKQSNETECLKTNSGQ